MAYRFNLNETSYHGSGAIKEIANEAKGRGFKKAFVCSDPDLIKFNVTKKVLDVLDEAGLAYEVYSDIKANPTIENVQHGVAAFKASGADYIIAIGGGSSMDTAKAIGIIITNPEFEDVRSLEGTAPTKNACTPIIAVPTTAGTAAEVTINYVINRRSRRSRHDVDNAEGPHSFHRHGCPHPCNRRIYNKRCMGDVGHVPPQGNRDHQQKSEKGRCE